MIPPMTAAEHHADAVLRAAGSALRNYTMPSNRAAICQAMQDALNAAYLSGFMASSEGWNGEYPYADRGESPTDDPKWLAMRARCIGTHTPEAGR